MSSSRKPWMRLLVVAASAATLISVAGGAWFYYTVFHRVEGHYFVSDGVRIHYTDEGQGEPVVLIHGFAANADANWRSPGITGKLAKQFRVIAIDNRGHGLSDKPHDPGQYGVDMVEDVPRLLDHLKIEKAHIVGYSMGAFITLKLLTLHPDRFLTATLGGAGHQPPAEEDLKFFEAMVKSLESGGGYEPLFMRLTPIGKEPDRARIAQFSRVLKWLNDEQAIAAVTQSFAEFVADEEKIKSTTIPVLQVCGTLDPLRTGVERLSELLTTEEVVWIEEADHISAMRRPELADAIAGFLTRHSGPASAAVASN